MMQLIALLCEYEQLQCNEMTRTRKCVDCSCRFYISCDWNSCSLIITISSVSWWMDMNVSLIVSEKKKGTHLNKNKIFSNLDVAQYLKSFFLFFLMIFVRATRPRVKLYIRQNKLVSCVISICCNQMNYRIRKLRRHIL